MRASDRAGLRLLAPALGAALGCALPALPRVLETTHRAAHAALGRDQGIFQYVAWAVLRGDVLYRDVRDVNGPLVAMMHGFVLAVLGRSDAAFRVFDLSITGASFALVGASLVDLDDRRGKLVERLAWATAAWVILSAQYLAYGYWDTAQRESFFDVFVALGLAAALHAQRALRTGGPTRRTSCFLGLAGACAAIPCTGKPTYLLFAIAQAAALLVDDVAVPRAERLRPFAAGALAGLMGPVVFLVLRGDVRSYLAISLVDVPTMYRFIWPRPLAEMVTTWAPAFALGTACAAFALALIATNVLPRRALAIALAPGLGLLSVVAQGKGFVYHFHPVTFGASLAMLAAVRTAASRTARRGLLAQLTAMALGVGLGLHAASALATPAFPPVASGDEDAPERLAAYERVDFFPRGLREAAAFLRARTPPDGRVFAYGMDAYLLFLAERRSAVPYIYAYDLDVDAALAGETVYGGAPPPEPARERIRSLQERHAADLARRLEEAPPAAVVLVDRSPLMTRPSALVDLEVSAPRAAAVVGERFVEVAAFEGIHVWLPRTP